MMETTNLQEQNKPDGWEIIKLGDFVEHEKGKKPKSQTDTSTDTHNIPYIDIKAFEKNIIRSWTNGDGCRLCSESDFLMVWDGSRSGLVGKGMKGALGSTLVRINFPLMENDYAYYYLESKFLEINTRAKGVGIPHVDPNLLWNYDFPIPPTNEQRRIVGKIEELFSDLDKGVQSLKLAQSQLKTYRQSILKHAFEGKLTAAWREENADKLETADELLAKIKLEREKYYEQKLKDWQQAVKQWEENGKEGKKPTKPRKNSDVSNIPFQKKIDLPVSWMMCRVGQLFAVYVGATPSRKEPLYWNGNIPWVSSGEVTFCNIKDTTEKITELGINNTSTQIHPPGTLMLAMIGEGKTRGQAAILNISAAHNQNTAAIRVSETDCNSVLYYNYFKYQYEITRNI